MFPVLLIVIGIAVLAFGRLLPVLGMAVGALLGVALLALFPEDAGPWITFGLPIGLALIGLLFAGFARGVIDVVVLVIGAFAGATIVLAFMSIFGLDFGMTNWLFALIGGVIGLMAIRRSRKATKDWGLIILACLVGGLLVTRGLVILIPSLQGIISALIAVVLAGGGIVYQGGFLGKDEVEETA